MHFKVFGNNIKIEKKDLAKESIAGLYNSKLKKIEIDKKLTGDDLNIVYVHELFHAMCDRLGLHNAQLSHDLEEILADNFATLIVENFNLKCKQHR